MEYQQGGMSADPMGVDAMLQPPQMRERSRSPRRDGTQAVADALGAVLAAAGGSPQQQQQLQQPFAVQGSAGIAGGFGGAGDADQTISTEYALPSNKLGQLLGFKGLTIQRIKEASGVQRLHILDKDRAKYQATVAIQVTGLSANVSHCTRMLDALLAGDQTEIGHLTTYLNVDPPLIGKLMGYRGQTVKEMTEATGCYIEIQQHQDQGVDNGQPRLFFAGTPDRVDAAVSLAERFIASPGSRLDAVMPGGGSQPPQRAAPLPPLQAPQRASHAASAHQDGPPATGSLGAVAQALLNAMNAGGGGGSGVGGAPARPQLGAPAAAAAPAPVPHHQQPSALAVPQLNAGGAAAGGGGTATEPGGPLEERILEIPARFKGHLLGLKGQTIETIRQVSGVIKCHMNEKRSTDRSGTISVQIVGTPDRVEACAQMINGITIGDHSSIGHVTTYVMIDPSVVGKIMGHKGQTIKEMTERTGCYIEIQQYPEQGVFDGQPKLFIAGPGDKVDVAVNLIERFVVAPGSRLDTVLQPGELPSPQPTPPAVGTPQQQQGTQLAQQISALAGVLGSGGGGGRGGGGGGHHGGHQGGHHGGPGRHHQPAPASGNNSLASALATIVAALSGSSSANSASSGSQGPYNNNLEERIIEVPASKKGHLLGLRGQTIETIRQKSGVKKCHMMDKNMGAHTGSIGVQIVGAPANVQTCISMVNGVVNGDHSSIGHMTDVIPVDMYKVNGLMGHRGQTVTILKDLTGAYLDIQQGPQAGVPTGSAQIFMAGPPDKVAQARTVVTAFLSMMDHLPQGSLDNAGSGQGQGGADLSALLQGVMAATGVMPGM